MAVGFFWGLVSLGYWQVENTGYCGMFSGGNVGGRQASLRSNYHTRAPAWVGGKGEGGPELLVNERSSKSSKLTNI